MVESTPEDGQKDEEVEGADVLDDISSLPGGAANNGRCASSFLRLAGVTPDEATSGHSPWLMMQFSTSLMGPFLCSVALAAAREFYTLIFGADATTMGTAFLFVSFWGPLIYPFVGYIQDKELLGYIFPPGKWGRRAPWLMVNLIGLCMCSSILYLPPSQESVMLVLWLVPVLLAAQWCLANIFVAFEGSRVELYPMKGERVLIESMLKVSVGIASGIGGALMLLMLTNASFGMRLGLSLTIGVSGLISMLAVPVLRNGKKPADKSLIKKAHREWASVLMRDAVKHHAMMKFWQGAFDAGIVTFIPYYVFITAEVLGSDRNAFIAMSAAVVLCVEAVLLPVFTRKFRAGKWDMQLLCGTAHAVSAVVAPLLLAFLPFEPEFNLLGYIVFVRFCMAPQTYFRTNSLGWIVDEDCLKKFGRRREGTFIGVCNFVGSIGRASAAGFLFKGLTMSGLETRNCLDECDDFDDQAYTDCVNACERANIDAQPDSVLRYIDFMFYVVMPICQVLCAFHIFMFPIKGERLQNLGVEQIKAENSITESQRSNSQYRTGSERRTPSERQAAEEPKPGPETQDAGEEQSRSAASVAQTVDGSHEPTVPGETCKPISEPTQEIKESGLVLSSL